MQFITKSSQLEPLSAQTCTSAKPPVSQKILQENFSLRRGGGGHICPHPLAAASVSPEREKAPQPNTHTRVSECTKTHKCGNGCPQGCPLRLINNNNKKETHSHITAVACREKKPLFFRLFSFPFSSLIGEAASPGKCFMASGQSQSVDNAS